MLRTILVVDDSAMDRELAAQLLKRQGLEVLTARNGVEALEVLARESVDALLTDLQMPVMDGLQLVREVRIHHPSVPVILMTAYGSEEIASAALVGGAASYVPKQTLASHLREALRIVGQVVEAVRAREATRGLLEITESRFVVGYDAQGVRGLLRHLDDALVGVDFCDETERLQIGTALTEALTNALDHGNLELESGLRGGLADAYTDLGRERREQPPFCDRRVHVRMRLTPDRVTYIIRDEGAGFDPSTLPDPRHPDNLTKPSGRGIMLIEAFMDVVTFNPKGNQITMIKVRPDRSDPSLRSS